MAIRVSNLPTAIAADSADLLLLVETPIINSSTKHIGVGDFLDSFKGVPNGIAPLDGSAIVPTIHLPPIPSSIEIRNQTVPLVTGPTSIDFVGPAVTTTSVGADVTVSILSTVYSIDIPTTSGFGALNQRIHLVDTVALGASIASLPATPVPNEQIIFTDYKNNFGTNNLSIQPNAGQTILGVAGPRVLNTDGQILGLVWDGISDWIPFIGGTGTGGGGANFTSNREVLVTTKALANSDPYYQYLDPNGAAKDVILPDPPSLDSAFRIKTLDDNFDLNIKETAAGSTVVTLSAGTGVRSIDAHYDGTEWHIWQ